MIEPFLGWETLEGFFFLNAVHGFHGWMDGWMDGDSFSAWMLAFVRFLLKT